jgi:hypothetical protein
MALQDPWDWPLLLYVGTVFLRRSERAFWKMLPRKLHALVKVHTELNGGGNRAEEQPKQGFIDQVMF